MVDTGTGLAVLGPSAIVLKILGPTADYVGNNLQHWTETKAQNIQRVFEKAADRLGAERLSQPGQVPPRVLKGILEEGQFRDDELGAEYLGGVLASSRTQVGRDDRGAALVAMVGRLSSYQLRTHYIAYACAQRSLAGSELELGDPPTRKQNAFLLPVSTWVPAMQFSSAETEDSLAIVDHTLTGLAREGLIDSSLIGTGSKDHLKNGLNREVPEDGLIFTLSMPGIELFTAAHGLIGRPSELFQRDGSNFTIDPPIALDGEVIRVSDLPKV